MCQFTSLYSIEIGTIVRKCSIHLRFSGAPIELEHHSTMVLRGPFIGETLQFLGQPISFFQSGKKAYYSIVKK